MLKKTFLKKAISAFALIAFMTSCGPYMRQTIKPRRASLGQESPAKKELLELPKPQEKIVVAVYKFRDQTGQYKPSENGANWSTAVTQGATTILIRVLEESGWFIPIERENIGNLLNERKIIRMSRAQYEKADQDNESLLPPLLFAGVILEGGIISYETNVLTGGAGVSYMGADLSGEYREDRISIYIRAVSSSNGRVLKTVYTTKSILSQEVSTGIFRYITPTRILEAETGFTYNEPTEVCITEAIEKAVGSLVIEGIKDNLWGLQNQQDTASLAFKRYNEEKRTVYCADPMGRILDSNNRGLFSSGVLIGANYYYGDYSESALRPGTSFQFGFAVNRHFYVDVDIGYRGLEVKKIVDDGSLTSGLSLRYMFLPYEKITPFINLGLGFDYNSNGVGLSNMHFLPKSFGVFGLEFLVNNKMGINLCSGLNYYLDDRFDGISIGRYNDFNWGISLGLRYYFSCMK